MSIDQDEAAIRQAAILYAMRADRRGKTLCSQVLTDNIEIEGPGFRAEGIAAAFRKLIPNRALA